MELQQCTGPINKLAAFGISRESRRGGYTTFKDCPGLIKENFYDIQKRLYGGIFCKDITGWCVGDLVVWGLFGFSKEHKVPYRTLMDSKWVCKCTCGCWQVLRYRKIMDMKKGMRKAKCEKCIAGWDAK